MKKLFLPILFSLLSIASFAQPNPLYVAGAYKAKIFSNYVNRTFHFFGNSYTAGVGATSPPFRYSTVLVAMLNGTENNHAVSGSVLEHGTPLNPYGSSPNMEDNIAAIPTYNAATMSYLSFFFGINDIGYNAGTYDTAHFHNSYVVVMNAALAAGWPANKIIIISPQFMSANTYSGYASSTGTPIGGRQRNQDFVTCASNISGMYGCKYVSVFDAFRLNKDSILLTSGDAIHPNNSGHRLLAQTIYSVLGDSVYENGQSLAINGKTELQDLWLKSPTNLDSNYFVLGVNNNGRVGRMLANEIIRNSLVPQPVDLFMSGLLRVGAGSVSDPESIITQFNSVTGASGGFKATFGRFNGAFPSGTSGLSLELSLLGSDGYIGVTTRPAGSPGNLQIQRLGGRTTFNGIPQNHGTVEIFAGSGAQFTLYQAAGVLTDFSVDGAGTLTIAPSGKTVKFTAGTTAGATVNFPTSVAPTSPNEGDGWKDASNFNIRISGTNYILAKYLTAIATLDFSSTATQTSSDLTVTVTGAADGDPVIVNPPNGSTNNNCSFSAFVSAANTVTVRFNNWSTGSVDPASGSFKVVVIK